MEISDAIEKMIDFYNGNLHDINHFLKVWAFANSRTMYVQYYRSRLCNKSSKISAFLQGSYYFCRQQKCALQNSKKGRVLTRYALKPAYKLSALRKQPFVEFGRGVRSIPTVVATVIVQSKSDVAAESA